MEIKSPVFLLILIQLMIIILFISAYPQTSPSTCKMFNFGDSNSDTGAYCSGFGAPAVSVVPPGHENTCRFSDGLLYIDFLCENMGREPLSPYLEPVGADFTNGVNFAFGGAKIEGDDTFRLFIQSHQFARFEKRNRDLMTRGKGPKITRFEFQNAIFSFDIGQNNLAIALSSTYEEVVGEIPSLIHGLEKATKMMYSFGARKFLMYNTGPLGCLPLYVGAGKGRGMAVDEVGCVVAYNQIARIFNEGLQSLCTKLINTLQDVTVVYMDMYAIKYDLIVNHTKYGFGNPFEPCLNGSTICLDRSRTVMWDSVHYTEAANKIVASKIWSGNYAWPCIRFQDLCDKEIEVFTEKNYLLSYPENFDFNLLTIVVLKFANDMQLY